jgi:hypothetical protein
MGRETVAVCLWGGEVAEVELHLSNQFLELRADLGLDIPRGAIQEARIVNEGLQVLTEGQTLMIELGERNAISWQ